MLGLQQINAKWNELLEVSAIGCGKMESALRTVAIENESNPAKINWKC